MAIFMKVDGVDGDSVDENHDKWIDILSFNIGAHHPSNMQAGGGTSGGSAQVEQLGVQCMTNSATATLMNFCLNGTVKKVDLHMTMRFNDLEDTWVEIVLTNASITSLNQSHAASPDGTANSYDDMVFSYEDIEQKVYDQNPDGTRGAEKSWGWEVGTRIVR